MYQNEEHGVIWHGISPCAPRAYSPNRLAEKTLAPGIWEGSGRGGRIASSGYKDKRTFWNGRKCARSRKIDELWIGQEKRAL